MLRYNPESAPRPPRRTPEDCVRESVIICISMHGADSREGFLASWKRTQRRIGREILRYPRTEDVRHFAINYDVTDEGFLTIVEELLTQRVLVEC